MSQEKRQAILIGIMMAMLTIAAVWNVNWMMRQRRSAIYAANNLAACEALRDQIKSLRDKPAVASTEALASQELGKRLAAAAERSKLPGGPPKDVFPQSERSVEDSPYLIKPTLLTLRQVPLEKLATFLYYLSEDAGLKVRDLSLRSPRGEKAKDVWNAEATITYLIYKPSAKTPRER